VPTLSEARKLVGTWAADPVTGRRGDSIRYHFDLHGGSDLWQYLRDAHRASLHLNGLGTPISGRTPGVIGYKVKGGGYIHIAPSGIISFGY
jgi:hypothetical protein